MSKGTKTLREIQNRSANLLIEVQELQKQINVSETTTMDDLYWAGDEAALEALHESGIAAYDQVDGDITLTEIENILKNEVETLEQLIRVTIVMDDYHQRG